MLDNQHTNKDGGRVLVLCFDGTSYKFSDNNTNVVKFASLLDKTDADKQIMYYQAGVGTYTKPGVLNPVARWVAKTLDMAFACYLDMHIIEGYEFLMNNYREGDTIAFFGFSRGAYTARALAGMIHKVGLLMPGNRAQLAFAYKMYARSDKKGFKQSHAFRDAFCRTVRIDYMGLWDTVATVGVLRPRRLPFTAANDAVRIVRHALALDERRARFRPALWEHPRPTADSTPPTPQPGSPLPEKTGACAAPGVMQALNVLPALMERDASQDSVPNPAIVPPTPPDVPQPLPFPLATSAPAIATSPPVVSGGTSPRAAVSRRLDAVAAKLKRFKDGRRGEDARSPWISMQPVPATQSLPTVPTHAGVCDVDEERPRARGPSSSRELNKEKQREREYDTLRVEEKTRMNCGGGGGARRRTDVQEVWFAGCHGDVGGGLPESEDGLSRIALEWMVREVIRAQIGVRFDERKLRAMGMPMCAGGLSRMASASAPDLALGRSRANSAATTPRPRASSGAPLPTPVNVAHLGALGLASEGRARASSVTFPQAGSSTPGPSRPALASLPVSVSRQSLTPVFLGHGLSSAPVVVADVPTYYGALATAPIHDQLALNGQPLWWLCEVLPATYDFQDDDGRWVSQSRPNMGAARRMGKDPIMHISVLERRDALPQYAQCATWTGKPRYVM